MGGGAMQLPGLARATAGTNLQPPSRSHLNLPVSANCAAAPFWPTGTNPSYIGETSTRLEFLDGREERKPIGYYYDSVFGPVPSRPEVEKAMCDLRSFILGFHTSEFEWLQRMMYLYNSTVLQSMGCGRVDEAFRLLQTDPSVQRMVLSISSDKAVWDAILNNAAVQNLQLSLSTAKEERHQGSSEQTDLATLIVNWILDIIKAKVLELVEKFSCLVNTIFQPLEKKEQAADITDQLDDKLRSTLLLSVVILLIVVVTRAHGVV